MDMKRGAILFLSILVLALSPAVAPAQGFLGGALPTLPGLPSFGGMFGGDGACGSCGPKPFSLAGTVGWTYQAIDLDLDAEGPGIGGIQNLIHGYRFNGLMLGLTASAVSRTGFGGALNFSIYALGNSKDTENYNHNLALIQGSRHWHTKNDTYSFEGMGFYNFFSTAALVGGFRWDHLETSFERPSGQIAILGLAGDETVLVVNVYQPYVGVMVDQGGASRVMRIGLVGWPQLYGSVKYEQTVGAAAGVGGRFGGLSAGVTDGYFWEMFGEYGMREQAYMGAAVSVFGKWTQYHVKGDLSADEPLIGGGNLGSDRFKISMHRNAWTAGVKLDIPLALPVPFSF
jgi:hypothetical protein